MNEEISGTSTLPGSAPTTGFGKNAVARMGMDIPEPYSVFVHDYLTTLRSGTEFTTPEDVAEAVWRAVTERDSLHAATCFRPSTG
ncbi:hypothetical protein ACVINI_007465 [Rhizobium beringeri]